MDELEVRWLMAAETPDAEAILARLTARPVWQRQAASRGMGTSMFVTGAGQGTPPAKAICASCPVRLECADFAMADPDTCGVWGGATRRDRREMRRRRALA